MRKFRNKFRVTTWHWKYGKSFCRQQSDSIKTHWNVLCTQYVLGWSVKERYTEQNLSWNKFVTPVSKSFLKDVIDIIRLVRWKYIAFCWHDSRITRNYYITVISVTRNCKHEVVYVQFSLRISKYQMPLTCSNCVVNSFLILWSIRSDLSIVDDARPWCIFVFSLFPKFSCENATLLDGNIKKWNRAR